MDPQWIRSGSAVDPQWTRTTNAAFPLLQTAGAQPPSGSRYQATEARASRTEQSSLSAAACSSPRHLGSTRECATSDHLVIGSSPRLNHLASHRRAWTIPRPPPPPPRGSTRACPRWVPHHLLLLLARRSQKCCVVGRASADTDGDSKSSSSCDPQEIALAVYSVGGTCQAQVLCEHSQVPGA